MKRIPASIIVFLATIGPAVAAETTERAESLPDANRACMQVNGSDCVLRSEIAPPRTAALHGVAILPAETTERTESLPDANRACMDVNGPDCILRSESVPPRTAAPQGVAIVPASAPPAQRSIIMSPRR